MGIFGKGRGASEAKAREAARAAEGQQAWDLIHRFLQEGESVLAFADGRVAPSDELGASPMDGLPVWTAVTQARLARVSFHSPFHDGDGGNYADSDLLRQDDPHFAVFPGPNAGTSTLKYFYDGRNIASWWVPVDFGEKFEAVRRNPTPAILSETTKALYCKKRDSENPAFDDLIASLGRWTGNAWYCERCSQLLQSELRVEETVMPERCRACLRAVKIV